MPQRRLRFTLIAAGVLQTASLLPAAEPVQVWTKSQLEALPARAANDGATGIRLHDLGAWGAHSALVVSRSKSGEAELHKTKSDVLVIESGEATFESGGTIVSPRTTEPNEVRGPSIQGGESRRVGPGDVIHVPIGTPHRFTLAAGKQVTYFALKIESH